MQKIVPNAQVGPVPKPPSWREHRDPENRHSMERACVSETAAPFLPPVNSPQVKDSQILNSMLKQGMLGKQRRGEEGKFRIFSFPYPIMDR